MNRLNEDETPSKICLRCAARKLSGKPAKPCGTCILLNVDPMARIRANSARPSPLARFPSLQHSPSCAISACTESNIASRNGRSSWRRSQ